MKINKLFKGGIVLLIFYFGSSNIFAQNLTITGTVIEQSDNEKVPVSFATIVEVGTSNGTIADGDGNFSLKLLNSTTKLSVSYVGYTTTEIEINSTNQNKNITIELKSDNIIDEVEVVGKVNTASENLLLVKRKNAVVATENMGSDEFRRKGISDMAAGVSKMAGITKVGTHQIYVRGLGDRSNNAMLNDMPIANPNPDLKIIPLDLFSSKVIRNVTVSKVFSVNQYSDFCGATIKMQTKNYIDKPFFIIDLGTGFNSVSTFKNFNQMNGNTGFMSYTGYSIDRYRLNDEIKNSIIYQPETLQADPFNTDYSFDINRALPELSLGFTGGKNFKINSSTLGILIAASFNNNYQFQEGIDNFYNVQGETKYSYAYSKWDYATKSSFLTNIAYRINKKNEISYNFLFLNSSSDQIKENKGFHDTHEELFFRRSTYRKHCLINNQLKGKHDLGSKFEFEWKTAYALAKSDEPDRRQMVYKANPDFAYYYVLKLNNGDWNRFYRNLYENSFSGELQTNYYLGKKNQEKGIISLGVQANRKYRYFFSRQFDYNVDNINQVVDPMFPTQHFNDEGFRDGVLFMEELPNSSKDYEAGLDILASFLDFTYTISSFTFNVGVRAEYALQIVKFKKIGDRYSAPYRDAINEGLGVFPALNIKFSPTNRQNFRLSASKTQTRPEFKEIAPFLYAEGYGQGQIIGNENVTNQENYNLDLRYEFFPDRGEMITFAVFGKYLNNSIERVVIPSSTPTYTYKNTHVAYVAGAEFEVRAKLSSLFNIANEFGKAFVGFNATYLYNMIDLTKIESPSTNKKRPLQGASPYIINADFNIPIFFGENKTNQLIISTIYNVFGDRIHAVGDSGLKDIFEKRAHTLDFILKLSIGKHLGIGFSAKNILNPDIILYQEVNGVNRNLNKYKKGINLSLGISYKF